jgi:hypothetical protein
MKKKLAMCGLVLLFAGMVAAQQPQDANSGEQQTLELQKKTQNTVADLISVPFQSNTQFLFPK